MPYTIASFSQYYEALKTHPESLINGILGKKQEADFDVQGQHFRLVTSTSGGIQRLRVVRRHPNPGSAHGGGESWTQKLMFVIADNLFLRSGVRRMELALHSRETVAAGFQTRFLAKTIDTELAALFPELSLGCKPGTPDGKGDNDAGSFPCGNRTESPDASSQSPARYENCLPNLVVSAAHDIDSWARYPDPRGSISAKTIDRVQSRIVGRQLVLVFGEPDTDRRFEFHLALPGEPGKMARAVRDRQRLLDVALGTKGSGSYHNMAELLAEFVVQTVEEEMPALLADAARNAAVASGSEHFAFLPGCTEAGKTGKLTLAQRRLRKEAEPAIRIAVDNAMRECRIIARHFLTSTRKKAAIATLSAKTHSIFSEFQGLVGTIESIVRARASVSGDEKRTPTAIAQLACDRPQQDNRDAHRLSFWRKPGLFSRLLGRAPVSAEIVTTHLSSLATPVLAPAPRAYQQAAEYGLQRYVGNVCASSVEHAVQQLYDTEFDHALVSLFTRNLLCVPEDATLGQHNDELKRLLRAVRIGKTTFGALFERHKALQQPWPTGNLEDLPVSWSIKGAAMSPREAGGAALIANLLGEDWLTGFPPLEQYGVSKDSGEVFLRRYEKNGITPATVPHETTKPHPEPKAEPELGQGPEYVPEEDGPFAAGSGTVDASSSSESSDADVDSDSEVRLY